MEPVSEQAAPAGVTLADVIRHLVRHAPDLSDDNRAEHLAAVDDAFGIDPEPEPEPLLLPPPG